MAISRIGAAFIRAMHIAFVLWMVWAPFSKSDEHVVLHSIIVPFLFLHWATNSDQCALTMIERHLRGVDNDQSFMWHLVAPVYVIKDADLRIASRIAAAGLWAVSLRRVIRDPEMIRRVLAPPGARGGEADREERATTAK